MNTQAKIKMTADQFLAWCEHQTEGRYELVDGEVVRLAPERVKHVKAKYALARIVEDAILKARSSCMFLGDGVGVRIDAHHVREPDGCIVENPAVDDDALEIQDPVVLFEVSSPSTDGVDTVDKLVEYLSLPSVQHYVQINASRGFVIHHKREGANIAATRILRGGVLELSPPGIAISIEALLGKS